MKAPKAEKPLYFKAFRSFTKIFCTCLTQSDDLGRLVIPKEIRKIYKLKEGDSIEFYVSDNNEIMIRKYEHLSDHNQDLLTMLETFYELFKSTLYFYGDDQLISIFSDQKKELTEDAIFRIKTYHEESFHQIYFFKNEELCQSINVFPLVLDSHWVGSFILTDEIISDSMKSVIQTFIRLITRNIFE